MNIKRGLKENKYLIVVILIALLMFTPLYCDKYYKGHDSNYHINVIKAYSKSIHISKLQLIPTDILPELAKDFGYGTGIFYPQLPHLMTTYIYKILSIVGFTLCDAMKVTIIIVGILSLIFIYLLSLKINNNKKIAALSSIIFSIMPYRLSDIFVRDAFAEQFMFLFIPMVLLGLFELIDKNYKKFYLYFIIGYIGMLYSHLVMTLFFTLFLIPFFVIYFKEIFAWKNIKKLLISAIIILIMTSTFILPMLYHKINGNFVVFEDEDMAGIEKIKRYQLQISDFFKVTAVTENQSTSLNKDTSIQFYIPIIVVIFLGLTVYYNKNIVNKKAFIYFIFSIILAMFMSTKLYPWDKLPSILYMIQFPWRLETILVIYISIISPIWLLEFRKESYFNISCIILAIILISFGMNNINYNSTKNLNNNKLEFDPYSNSGMGSAKEYLPTKTKENMEYFDNRTDEIISLNNETVKIEKGYDKTPKLEFAITQINKQTQIELPRLFYYGYELKNITTGEKVSIYESKHGFIQADITTNGVYRLEYKGLEAVKILNIIKIITLIGIIIFCCVKKMIKKCN